MDKNYHVVGTAGHIDHGKSALIRALTGTDPDRLQEEQERGITIDIGFAHLELDGGTLTIDWRTDNHVMMIGATATSFKGTFNTALLGL